MAGLKSLVGLAFAGSIGMTLLILACALYDSWWPFFVLIFYLLAAVPTTVAQRYISYSGGHPSSYMDPVVFLTMGCVVSAFGLPIILARAPQNIITSAACQLTIAANIVIFLTLLGFFMIFQQDDTDTWG